MHLQLTVKIVYVDAYGFLGRDAHPTPDMIGELGEVLSMKTWTEEGVEEFDPTNESQNHGDFQITTLRVFLRSRGVVVELIGHEVQVVEAKVI